MTHPLAPDRRRMPRNRLLTTAWHWCASIPPEATRRASSLLPMHTADLVQDRRHAQRHHETGPLRGPRHSESAASSTIEPSSLVQRPHNACLDRRA